MGGAREANGGLWTAITPAKHWSRSCITAGKEDKTEVGSNPAFFGASIVHQGDLNPTASNDFKPMPRKILIVDDQEDILLIIEREFRRVPGFQVSSTSKFADALSLVSEKKIDLVISDVRIGRDSGFDLVREISRLHPHVGTILMSAYRSPSNRQQALDLGVFLFLEKPFLIARLIKEVDGYFTKKEAEAPAGTSPVSVTAATIAKSSSLSHFKLQDLVQLFCLNGRSILITVESDDHPESGKIYIQRGRVVHAAFEGKTGEEAFHVMMQLPQSKLKVKDSSATVPTTIETSWEHLLLQSAIQFDHHQ
jgi:DNA-binding response OmpR family regulator